MRALLDVADPVAAFHDAHRDGALIALPTSGTRQRARTVVRTTASWVDSFDAVTRLTGLDPGSRVWIPGPLSATMNLFAAVHASWVGAAPAADLAGATHAQLTPSALRALLDGSARLAGTTVVVAGDGLGPDLRERAEVAGARMEHYYGAAELSFVAWGRDSGSLQAFPGVEVDVRGSDLRQPGTIWARSAYLALRVDEEAPDPTSVLRSDPDGFATVGDRGRLDGARLVVVGRDETVVTGGTTVLLGDVEAALRPGLRGEVAALGLPHPRLGAIVAAVLTDDADLDLAKDAARQLDAARPRRWFVVSALPQTDAGKLDRIALAQTLVARR